MTVSGVPGGVWGNKSKQMDERQIRALDDVINHVSRVGWLAYPIVHPIPSHHILFWHPFLVDMTVSGVPERVWDNRSKQADDGQTSALDKRSRK